MAFLVNNQEYPISEGRIKLFSYQSSPLVVTETITPPSGSVGFGKSVVSQNGKIYVGDPDRDDGKGSVFVYDINGNLLETLTGSYTSTSGNQVQANSFGKKIVYNDGILAIVADNMLFIYTRYNLFTSAPSYINLESSLSNNVYVIRLDEYVGSSISTVAIGDGYIVIGDPAYNTGRGRVSLFDYNVKSFRIAGAGLESYDPLTISGSEYYSNYNGFGRDIAVGGQRFVVAAGGERVIRVFNFAMEQVMQILNPDTNSTCSRYVKIGCGRIMIGGPSSVSVYDMHGELQFTKTALSEGFASFNSIDIGYGVIAMAEASGGVGRVHVYDLNGELLKRNDFGNANITVSIDGKYITVCKENQSLSLIKGIDSMDNRIQMRSESLNSRYNTQDPNGAEFEPYYPGVSFWYAW